jgi:hypothetical protein
MMAITQQKKQINHKDANKAHKGYIFPSSTSASLWSKSSVRVVSG